MKKTFNIASAVLILISFSFTNTIYSQTKQDLATFIFNVVSFFDWSAVQNPSLRLYIYRDPELSQNLITYTGSMKIQNRALLIKSVEDVETILKEKPEVVYVGPEYPNILKQLTGKSFLLLTYNENGTTKGADIVFSPDGQNRLTYYYNDVSLHNKGLTYENRLAEFGKPAR